jgi:prepilin-type N-terminal cleavage/methylation domain-containing protein
MESKAISSRRIAEVNASIFLGRRRVNRRSRAAFTLVEIMIVVLIIATLLNIALPNMLTARNNAWSKTCVANLTMIYTAKQQWAIDNKQAGSAFPTWSNLQPYVNSQFISTVGPVCPASGEPYNINQVDQFPTCPSYPGPPFNHSMT